MTQEMLNTIIPLASGALGWVFQSQSSARQQLFDIAMAKSRSSDESADKAAKRGATMGTVIRFLLVVAAIFGVILIPWFAVKLNIPIVSEVVKTKTGLLGRTREIVEYVTINGYPVFSEVKMLLASAGMFYIGRLAGK